MDPARTVTLKVVDAPELSAPPTWGHRTIWEWHGFFDAPEGAFNNAQLFDLPAGLDVDTVADALVTLLRRNDALRTVFDVSEGRVVRQHVEGDGELTVEVHEAEPDRAREVGDAVAAALSAVPWTCREWPLRVAMIDTGGSVPLLVMSHNRLLLDVQSMDFITLEVAAHATGSGADLPRRWQPVDEAEFEEGPEGRALSDRAVRYWRTLMESTPATMYDYPVRTPDAERFVMAQIESRPLAMAVHALRRRWRVTGGPLVLAAASLAVGTFTGHDDVAMLMFAGNRTHADRRWMLGTLLSGGALQVPLAGLGFDEIARASLRTVRAAHQSGYCDPDDLAAVRAEVERTRGVHLDLSLFFNDMQTGQDAPDPDPAATDGELAALAAGEFRPAPISWGGWDEVWQARVTHQDIRFMLTTQHSTNMPLMLFCDTRYFSRETMAQLVTGIERLLVTAAGTGTTDAAQLAAASGVTPVARDVDWLRCADGGWVHLPSARALWREVTGTADGALVPRPDGLHAYVAGPGPDPAQLHAAFLTAIGTRSDVRTPVAYHRVAGPVAGPDWADAPVLVTGDGRS